MGWMRAARRAAICHAHCAAFGVALCAALDLSHLSRLTRRPSGVAVGAHRSFEQEEAAAKAERLHLVRVRVRVRVRFRASVGLGLGLGRQSRVAAPG